MARFEYVLSVFSRSSKRLVTFLSISLIFRPRRGDVPLLSLLLELSESGEEAAVATAAVESAVDGLPLVPYDLRLVMTMMNQAMMIYKEIM